MISLPMMRIGAPLANVPTAADTPAAVAMSTLPAISAWIDSGPAWVYRISRSSPCFLKIPPRCPSSAMPASQAPRCGTAIFSVSWAAAEPTGAAVTVMAVSAESILREIMPFFPLFFSSRKLYHTRSKHGPKPACATGNRKRMGALHRIQSPGSLLQDEFAQEKASALGRLGRALESSLETLASFDSRHDPGTAQPPELERHRVFLVQEASVALWCFIVQRESCGLRDLRSVLRDYRVPNDVA